MTPSKNKGFTLLETLIAFVVLTVGLLGAVALLAQAKQASYDSLQRAAALNLSNDIISRISANDTAAAMAIYKTNINYTQAPNSSNKGECFENLCTGAQLANFDIEQWRRAINAADGTGTLSGATVCIDPVVNVDQVELSVIISWLGRQKITQSEKNAAVECGSTDAKRKMISVKRYLFMRAV